MYPIGALSEPLHSPFPALGRWCDSVRPGISGVVPIEAIQLHIFLALPPVTCISVLRSEPPGISSPTPYPTRVGATYAASPALVTGFSTAGRLSLRSADLSLFVSQNVK